MIMIIINPKEYINNINYELSKKKKKRNKFSY